MGQADAPGTVWCGEVMAVFALNPAALLVATMGGAYSWDEFKLPELMFSLVWLSWLSVFRGRGRGRTELFLLLSLLMLMLFWSLLELLLVVLLVVILLLLLFSIPVMLVALFSVIVGGLILTIVLVALLSRLTTLELGLKSRTGALESAPLSACLILLPPPPPPLLLLPADPPL